ncbi:unnamed protein product [Paramecium primaurelia]|uniref:Uncharacterized protein n=1 Tax=Paramecium primaurelia TaxID=5886 RepID=A0A8S1NIT6_PARPR|nr:unnamed protein product [Paramecium primaurelia]
MNQSQLQTFSYKLVPQSSVHQNSLYRVIAINKNQTLLLDQMEYFIKCCAFKSGEINYYNYLILEMLFTILQIFKTRNKILFQVQIHSFVNIHQGQWLIQNIFKNFMDIQYKVLNFAHFLNENMIIKGSNIGFLFTNQIGSNKPFQQTIKEHISVFGLSIKDQGTRLISCGKDYFILIIEPTNSELQKYIWTIKQKLIVEQYSYNQSYMNFYCEKNDLYHKQSQRLLNSNKQDQFCIFQQVYNQKKSFIFNIYGRVLQIIRVSNNQPLNSGLTYELLQLEQSIDFGNRYNPWIYGIIRDDAEYIITWDLNQSRYKLNNFRLIIEIIYFIINYIIKQLYKWMRIIVKIKQRVKRYTILR